MESSPAPTLEDNLVSQVNHLSLVDSQGQDHGDSTNLG